jgi:hypothetical protein
MINGNRIAGTTGICLVAASAVFGLDGHRDGLDVPPAADAMYLATFSPVFSRPGARREQLGLRSRDSVVVPTRCWAASVSSRRGSAVAATPSEHSSDASPGDLHRARPAVAAFWAGVLSRSSRFPAITGRPAPTVPRGVAFDRLAHLVGHVLTRDQQVQQIHRPLLQFRALQQRLHWYVGAAPAPSTSHPL